MKDILSKIVAHKKEEIAAARRRLPEQRLREQALMPRKKRPFIKRLEHPGPSGVNIIAEIKRASPSKGITSSVPSTALRSKPGCRVKQTKLAESKKDRNRKVSV